MGRTCRTYVRTWWGRIESNYLPKRYEHPALTDELRPHALSILSLLRYNVENNAKQTKTTKTPDLSHPL